MGRAPCCDKVGLNKGPWTPQEDKILVAFIQKHGHQNWRALPKQAGLLRCGKSCRLRWINYLRPDIKRGNVTREEEDAIIELHEKLGNRWSAIAARLPGRTDNEIKNVWHTHLKKRLQRKCDSDSACQSQPMNFTSAGKMSPQPSFGESPSTAESSMGTGETQNSGIKNDEMDFLEPFPDERFWSDALLSRDNSSVLSDFPADFTEELQLQFPFSSVKAPAFGLEQCSNIDDGMDFWYELFVRPEL